jgi:hypothetical protein
MNDDPTQGNVSGHLDLDPDDPNDWFFDLFDVDGDHE